MLHSVDSPQPTLLRSCSCTQPLQRTCTHTFMNVDSSIALSASPSSGMPRQAWYVSMLAGKGPRELILACCERGWVGGTQPGPMLLAP